MLVGLLRIVNLGVDSVADGWFWVNLNEGYSMGFGDGEWLVACAQLGSMVGARCFGWQGSELSAREVTGEGFDEGSCTGCKVDCSVEAVFGSGGRENGGLVFDDDEWKMNQRGDDKHGQKGHLDLPWGNAAV
ncbi:hypothetical protein V6N13_123924 [Hibiscus sabdariffa]